MTPAERLTEIIANALHHSATHLPDDVLTKLETLYAAEQNERGRAVYAAMFEDLRLAHTLSRPLCQDTGIQQFFVQAGTGFPHLNLVPETLISAVRTATVQTPLRPNTVTVFDEKNTGDNIAPGAPVVDWELIPDRDDLRVYTYMAGGGCSLPGLAQVLMPVDGYEKMVELVFDRVTDYGVNACPPLLIGIGLAGSAEVAAKLSKKALLRFIGTRNPNPRAGELERRLEDGLNALGIGAGGLSGSASVLGVHIEQAARHPATLAVGLSTGCWAHRRGLIEIDRDLTARFISHKEARL